MLGSSVTANDVRGGAALLTAGLLAHGTTDIIDSQFIDKGYENWVEKLNCLSADVKIIK